LELPLSVGKKKKIEDNISEHQLLKKKEKKKETEEGIRSRRLSTICGTAFRRKKNDELLPARLGCAGLKEKKKRKEGNGRFLP